VTVGTDDLAARVEDAATPRPVPWGGSFARLRASTTLRRFVPAPVALAGLDLAVRASIRLRPERLARARAAMAAVVGGTPLEAELPVLAVRHLAAWPRAWETAWRPWAVRRLPLEGLEGVRAVEPGRGVVFSRTHYGVPAGMASLPRSVGPIHLGVGGHLLSDAAPGYDGYQNEQTRRLLTRGGWRLVRARGSHELFAEVLRSGGRVQLNLDVPGSAPVRFLGKTVEMASGTARLAWETDSVVVPAAVLRRGRGWVGHLDAPIDPRDHPTWESLLQAVADVHSRLVLTAPEYLESPLRDGGWAVATGAGWRRAR
jgi:lauroyl/myristoyl acyltransferase